MTRSPDVREATDLTYDSYLKVPQLLALQEPLSEPNHHDELLFIIIHQAYELWFKLILHEVEKAMQFMGEGQLLRARHFIHRAVQIMKLLVDQIHILETMTPADFLEFRNHLNPASGFQSTQFRELEFAAGLKDPRYLRYFQNLPASVEKLNRRLAEPDLRQTYHELLRGLGFDLPSAPLPWDEATEKEATLALLPLYQAPEKHMPLYMLSESLLELDEQLILWRIHHVHVVERIIGGRTGTGGSSGSSYLRTTTEKKCFPELWAVRTVLQEGHGIA
jgi:tryptophan 2,3-dioxygenase